MNPNYQVLCPMDLIAALTYQQSTRGSCWPKNEVVMALVKNVAASKSFHTNFEEKYFILLVQHNQGDCSKGMD